MQDHPSPAIAAMQFFPFLKEEMCMEAKVNKEKLFSIPKVTRE